MNDYVSVQAEHGIVVQQLMSLQQSVLETVWQEMMMVVWSVWRIAQVTTHITTVKLYSYIAISKYIYV